MSNCTTNQIIPNGFLAHAILRFCLSPLPFFLLVLALPFTSRAQNEVEPNNTFADANTVNFGTPFNASINPAGDQDYFKFVVTQAGVVNVNLSNVPSNIPMRYRFYNTNQQLVTDFNYAAGINFTRQQLVCEPGVYYLRLSANSTSVSNAAQYTVLFTFDTSDVYECNNVLGDAALVQINQPINASIWPAGDQDYYKFEVTQAGVVSVTLSNIPSNITKRRNLLHQHKPAAGQMAIISTFSQTVRH